MVVINSSLDEMNGLIGKKLTLNDYQEMSFKYGLDLESDGIYLNFELTSDRTELISKYALAFLFSQFLGSNFRRHDKLPISTDRRIHIKKTSRPFVNILRLKLERPIGSALNDLIEIEEKLDFVVGRKRASAAIGLFDASKLSFPITYSEMEKKDVHFAPLGKTEAQGYDEIINGTEQGRNYSELTDAKAVVWLDSSGRIFAMPPIINADFSSITEKTREILIDVTGPNSSAVNSLTKSLAFNLQFFGDVSIIQPARASTSLDTGLSLSSTGFKLDTASVKKTLGIDISLADIIRLLKSADYSVSKANKSIIVTPKFYRQDVIHQVDIIDDILRFFGVDKLSTPPLRTYTSGKKLDGTQLQEDARDALVGLGYEETDLNVLTNKSVQLEMTGIDSTDYARIRGSKSGEIDMARLNLFPEMLRFISNNLHKRFPQNLFEIGTVVKAESCDVSFKNRLKMCIVSCSEASNLSVVKLALERALKDSAEIKEISLEENEYLLPVKGAFIEGRVGSVKINGNNVGFIGEVHPKVLNNFRLELPVSVAEIFLDEIL